MDVPGYLKGASVASVSVPRQYGPDSAGNFQHLAHADQIGIKLVVPPQRRFTDGIAPGYGAQGFPGRCTANQVPGLG
jgi:hypothetical protein